MWQGMELIRKLYLKFQSQKLKIYKYVPTAFQLSFSNVILKFIMHFKDFPI